MTLRPDDAPLGAEDTAVLYARLAAGEFDRGHRGTVLFVVSTDDPRAGRGDLYVALGLARFLNLEGWGVRLLPMSHWDHDGGEGVDVAIVMIESFIPGFLRPEIATIAWVRNWTDTWASLPYLSAFDAVWASSAASESRLIQAGATNTSVIPLAADHLLFRPSDAERDLPAFTSINLWGNGRAGATAIKEIGSALDVTWAGHGVEDSPGVHALGPIDYFSLADRYARSVIVIDDLISQALAYGNHNSRLFEAIAAGAVPVTTTDRGLTELGLNAVPTYATAGDLIELAASLSNESARSALSNALSEVVLERHTFEKRAKQVSPLLQAVIADHMPRPRDRMLLWAAQERWHKMSIEIDRDAHRARTYELGARLEELERDAQTDRRPLNASRTWLRRRLRP